MELLRGLSGLRSHHRPSVATIGAFDGIHRGHQAVIAQLLEQGRALRVPTVAVVFEPLPREYLAADVAPPRLQSFREKFEALAALGVDRLLCLRFNETLRNMSADEFARQVFVDGLGVRALVLGDDFRFGRSREGDAQFMRDLGAEEGFSTLATRTVELAGDRISSSRLRRALGEGDFQLAGELLGRPYSISGRVIYGRQLGRTIGAPTANIALRRPSAALQGVYTVTVNGAQMRDAPGIANIGTRPTVDAGTRPQLEVHLLEGSPELYGKRLTVSFQHKIRDEQRFESVDALKEQIASDIACARDWFARRAGEADS